MGTVEDLLKIGAEEWSALFKDDLNELVRSISFSGFDPAELRKTIWTKSGNKVLDIQKAMLVFLHRGSHLTNIMSKTSGSENKKYIAEIVRKFGIKTQDGRKKPLERSDVTLPRMAACFPEVMAKLMQQLSTEEVSIRFGPTGYPEVFSQFKGYDRSFAFIFSQTFISLVSSDNSNVKQLFSIALFMAHGVSSIVDKTYSEKFKTQGFSVVSVFVVNAYNSNLVSNANRIKWMERLVPDEMLDQFEQFIGECVAYIYGHYPTLEEAVNGVFLNE